MIGNMLATLKKKIGQLSGVHIEPIDLKLDFFELAARFTHLPGTVVLASGGELDSARYHVMGVLPWLTLSASSEQTEVTIDQQKYNITIDPFDLLREIMNQLALPQGDWPPPLAAGLLGYLSYDLKDSLEQLPRSCVDDLNLPQMLLYAHALLVVHDKQTNITQLLVPKRQVATSDSDNNVDQLMEQFHALASEDRSEISQFGAKTDEIASNFTQNAYENVVQKIIDNIRAGDVYQVNISQRFQVPFAGDSFSLFSYLYQQNPAPFFAFVQAGDHQIVSTSPERFLLRSGSRVEARPIKGTCPRGKTMEEDAALRQSLINSTKDGAELSMIVDLLRNDISKVCSPFSVQVSEHKRVESYKNVHHLVSIVEGQLDADKDTIDLLKASFPGGSITGCPKIRAMEIIDELETYRRHIYCGSIGYLSFHNSMDLSIAIRTATIVNNTLYFSVGGGIVFDSEPSSEYKETIHKGETLLTACQLRQTNALGEREPF